MSNFQNIINLTNDVAAVTAAGGKTTREYDRINERWDDFNTIETPARDALTAAVIGKESLQRIGELKALAIAEDSTPIKEAELRDHIAGEIYAALRREYKTVAEHNYTTLADQYTITGTKFENAHETIHPETDPAQLLSSSEKERTAWMDAGILAQQLTNQIGALTIAARLAGATAHGEEATLALTTKPGDTHRRRVWEAWESTGRTGRWAALCDLGLRLEAPDLEEFTPYRRPAPIEIQYQYNGIGHAPYEVDPEDPTEEETPTA